MCAARTALSARRVPRTNIAPRPDPSADIDLMNASLGFIFRRSVHHLNFGRGAAYPRPMSMTQNDSSILGMSRTATTGMVWAAAAAVIEACWRSTHDEMMGFSTRVSVEIRNTVL
jgi:hypothetical protein